MILINVLSFLDPFDCGATTGCGGDGWLISDTSLLPFVVNATCADSAATPFTSLSALNCKCPTTSILPCTCLPTSGSDTTLTISCAAQSLSDSAMNKIVSNIDPTTPVDTMDLSSNKLTFIPKGLPKLKQLVNLIVSSNAITTIETSDLTVTGSVTNLDLSSNLIATIADSSLPCAINIFYYSFIHCTIKS